jgi:hypothetical protein
MKDSVYAGKQVILLAPQVPFVPKAFPADPQEVRPEPYDGPSITELIESVNAIARELGRPQNRK